MDRQEKQRLTATLRQRIAGLISASKGHASEMYLVTHVALACALASLELGLEADRASMTDERKRASVMLVVEQVGEALLRTEQVLADDFVHAITSEIPSPLDNSAEENQEVWKPSRSSRYGPHLHDVSAAPLALVRNRGRLSSLSEQGPDQTCLVLRFRRGMHPCRRQFSPDWC